MAIDRSQSWGFWGTAAASAVAGAVLVLVVFGAGPTRAGRAQKKHAARTEQVTVDGTLARDGEGWVVNVRSVNSGADEQSCELGTRLTSTRNSPMSRVPPRPKVIWQSTVAVQVPAGAEREQRLAVPEEIAKRVTAARAKPAKEDPFAVTESFHVEVEARCAKKIGDGVS